LARDLKGSLHENSDLKVEGKSMESQRPRGSGRKGKETSILKRKVDNTPQRGQSLKKKNLNDKYPFLSGAAAKKKTSSGGAREPKRTNQSVG